MSEFGVREANGEDLSFLRAMLLEAAYWRPGDRPADLDLALSRPDLVYLLADYGRSGDVGVVAEQGERPLGAAWFRTWTPDLHSYGFVDEATPELAIGVQSEWRGRGVGAALLSRLLELANRRGIGRVSLSVELDNPARRLYERVGFEPYEEADGAITMVAECGEAMAESGRRSVDIEQIE